MRAAFPVPLSITLVVVAGCGSHVKEQAARSQLAIQRYSAPGHLGKRGRSCAHAYTSA
jgi:hypothetical protein